MLCFFLFYFVVKHFVFKLGDLSLGELKKSHII